MQIVALGHYSRTGKDTFANSLEQHLRRIAPWMSYAKIPLAWKLKQIAYDLYSWDGLREPEFYDTLEGAPYRDIKLSTVGMTPVEIWGSLGTAAIRDHVYDRTWLDYLSKSDHGVDVLAVPDIRFPNEFDAFLDAGAVLIQVVRPGYGPRKTRADRALMEEHRWHYVIGGTGELSELDYWALRLAEHLSIGSELPTQTPAERKWQLSQQVIQPWEPEPIRHVSPNGAHPESFAYAAEVSWIAAGLGPIPVQSTHPLIYQAMIDQFGE